MTAERHPAERAEVAAAARRRVLAWAASEGVRVSPAAADRLVGQLAGALDVPEVDGLAQVVPLRRPLWRLNE